MVYIGFLQIQSDFGISKVLFGSQILISLVWSTEDISLQTYSYKLYNLQILSMLTNLNETDKSQKLLQISTILTNLHNSYKFKQFLGIL